MTRKLYVFFMILLIFVSFKSYASDSVYFWDENKLNESQKENYKEIRNKIDSLTGKTDELDKAQQMVATFIKEQPNFLPIYIEEARFMIVQGYKGSDDFKSSNKKALEIIKEIQKKDPQYPKSYILAGHILTNLEEYEQADKSLKKAEELGTTDPWLYINKASILIVYKKYEDAKESLFEALKHNTGNKKASDSAILLLCEISDRTDKFINVPSLIKKLYQTPEERIEIAQKIVKNYNRNPQIIDHATQILGWITEDSPKYKEAQMALAQAYLARVYKGSYNGVKKYATSGVTIKEALAPLKDIKEFQDDSYSILIDLAFSKNDLQVAGELIKEASEKGVSPTIIKLKKASLHYQIGNYEETVKIYNELAKENVSYKSSYILMLAYKKLGKGDRVKEYYKQSLEKNPNDARALGAYAYYLLHEEKDSASAAAFGERALGIKSYWAARKTTAMAYIVEADKKLSKGDIKNGLRLFKKSETFGFKKRHLNRDCVPYCGEVQRVYRAFTKKAKKLRPLPTPAEEENSLEDHHLLQFFDQLNVLYHESKDFELFKESMKMHYQYRVTSDFQRNAEVKYEYECDEVSDNKNKTKILSQDRDEVIEAMFPEGIEKTYDIHKYKRSKMRVNKEKQEIMTDYTLVLGGTIKHTHFPDSKTEVAPFKDLRRCQALFIYDDGEARMKAEQCDIIISEGCRKPVE